MERIVDAFEWLCLNFQFLFDWLFTPIEMNILDNIYYLGAPIYLLIGGSGVILVALFAWKLFLG